MLIVALLVLMILGTYSSKVSDLREITEDKVLWEPTFDQFKEYIVKGPRDYDILAFFTSGNDSWCQSCSVIKTELEKLSEWYSSSVALENRDIFFSLSDWDRHTSIFSSFKEKIYTMPSLIIIPKTEKKRNTIYDYRKR